MRQELNVHDLLSGNLLRLLRKSTIRRREDLVRLKRIHSAEFFEPLHEDLTKLPFVSNVKFDFCPHSAASSFFRLKFRGRALGGMSLQISHVVPIFCWEFVPPEGFVGPITFETPKEVWSKWIRDYKKALRRKAPEKAKVSGQRVLDELAAYGLMEIPRRELDRCPSCPATLPKSLKDYSLAFFYFESIPWS
jgi:hypothetical protein